MNKVISPFMLGATLYMPATRTDLVEIILYGKIPELRSMVICLEDAVSDEDLDSALCNLAVLLVQLKSSANIKHIENRPLVFIRPRHEHMAQELVVKYDLVGIDGFVLPKFTRTNLPLWWKIISTTHLAIMPTFETREVYDVTEMTALAELLESHACRDRIVALRIGGNDLMSVISMRHPKNHTLYEGPMGYVIKMLVSVFASRGFSLTAPVCEQIDNVKLLERELMQDVAHGLVGKTAIHPSHLTLIHQGFMVEKDDYEDALRILNSSQAVFKSQGAMCEPATHRNWAITVLERSKYCGIAKQFNNVVLASLQ
ncbi:HpcH/HpaI aldolase/citrate lyase family protein [Rosenbergiella collisarenosi]|uniref:HpcH/HpaI aldolase/citrate lyase family protein n=1 Tax=Rosenbergiella collisarenosi TaxID=1544695 RepID=UPI001F4EE5CD|nr:HpcH/HpaI aldolase/citrate lyase family protein [Rosenbergiella collisarenosi]